MFSEKCAIIKADGYIKIIGIIESEFSQNEDEKDKKSRDKNRGKYRDGKDIFEGMAKIYRQIILVKGGGNSKSPRFAII